MYRAFTAKVRLCDGSQGEHLKSSGEGSRKSKPSQLNDQIVKGQHCKIRWTCCQLANGDFKTFAMSIVS